MVSQLRRLEAWKPKVLAKEGALRAGREQSVKAIFLLPFFYNVFFSSVYLCDRILPFIG